MSRISICIATALVMSAAIVTASAQAPAPAAKKFSRQHLREMMAQWKQNRPKLAACRKQGYAYNAEELFMGDMGIAAPIVDQRGRPQGAVHVSPPTSRWTLEAAQQKLAPMVIECARAISSALLH